MQDFIDDFRVFRDQFGLIQLDHHSNGKVKLSQNGALFTMEYLITMYEVARKANDSNTFVSELTKAVETYEKLWTPKESDFGFGTVRYPGSYEQDSMDNIGAIIAFYQFARAYIPMGGNKFAQDMLAHGKEVVCDGYDTRDPRTKRTFVLLKLLIGEKRIKNFWNTLNPTKFDVRGWFGRSPGFMAMLRLAAGEKVGLFGKLAILIGQFQCIFRNKKDTDAWKLPYVNWFWLARSSAKWNKAYRLWTWFLLNKYKNGMQDVYNIYYKKHHPLARHAIKHFEA